MNDSYFQLYCDGVDKAKENRQALVDLLIHLDDRKTEELLEYNDLSELILELRWTINNNYKRNVK